MLKMTVKRLEEAVPEAIEVAFITPDEGVLVSVALSLEQAFDLRESLHKALKVVAVPTNNYGLPTVCFDSAVALLRHKDSAGYHTFKIAAIKDIRSETNLGLKESKDIADSICTRIDKGEL